jgi:hypothetical protein
MTQEEYIRRIETAIRAAADDALRHGVMPTWQQRRIMELKLLEALQGELEAQREGGQRTAADHRWFIDMLIFSLAYNIEVLAAVTGRGAH